MSGDFSGGSGTTGNYTEEEMRMALIILSIILSIFLAILSCQCYQKILYELIQNGGSGAGGGGHCGHADEEECQEVGCKGSKVSADIPENEGKPLPCAPYSRQASICVPMAPSNYGSNVVQLNNDWNSRRSSMSQFVVIPNTAIGGRDPFCPAHLV